MNIKKRTATLLSNDTFAINLTDFAMDAVVQDGSVTKTAEYYIDLYAKNRLPSFMRGQTSYNLDSFKQDVEFLTRKMEAVRKTLSIWESYRITEVAFNRDELEYKLGALPPNSGLVVNFEADDVTIGDKQYSQGDVVFTDYIGNQYILKSFSGGYYYPYQIKPADTPGVYQIFYAYTTAAPVPGTITLATTTLQTPYQEIQIELKEADTKDRYDFSQAIGPKKDIEIPALFHSKGEKVLIRPIVTWYLVDPNDTTIKTDRIYFDIEWSYNKSKETIRVYNETNQTCWCEVR